MTGIRSPTPVALPISARGCLDSWRPLCGGASEWKLDGPPDARQTGTCLASQSKRIHLRIEVRAPQRCPDAHPDEFLSGRNNLQYSRIAVLAITRSHLEEARLKRSGFSLLELTMVNSSSEKPERFNRASSKWLRVIARTAIREYCKLLRPDKNSSGCASGHR